MSKNAKISARTRILEEKLKKSFNQLGLAAGLGNGTVDGWTDNQIDKSTLSVEKFLDFHKINPEWWKSGDGEVFLTSVHKTSDNKQMELNADKMYRDFVEANSVYTLVPKTILDGAYRIMLESELKDRAEMWKETLAAKNDAIAQLKKEVAELRSGVRAGTGVKAKNA
jgi:hypothetical protein